MKWIVPKLVRKERALGLTCGLAAGFAGGLLCGIAALSKEFDSAAFVGAVFLVLWTACCTYAITGRTWRTLTGHYEEELREALKTTEKPG